MRIAIVLPPGGVFDVDRPNSMETVVRTLSAHAADDEYLCVFCETGATARGDIPTLAIAGGPGRDGRMVKALEAFAPDIIEFHQHTPSAARLALRFPRVAKLLYRHNDVKPPRGFLDAWRYRRRYRLFDRLVFVSDASRAAFVTDYPELRDRAATVRNAIDAEAWRADPDVREPLIVFAGRAIPEKGVDMLCGAMPGVLAAHPHWRADLFLGDWEKHAAWIAPHVDQMLAKTDRVGVHRHAPLADVREALRRAAIAVIPSVWAEPLGLAALEAHAAGAALVSSGRGGLREASGEHALYLEDLSADAIAAAIDDLIQNPDLRLRLAREGQAFVVANHSPAARAADLAALRREVLASR